MTGTIRDVTNVLRLLGAFVVLAVVMGLLAAGLFIPAVGATGSAAKGGVAIFEELPGELTRTPLNQQSRILDAGGNVIATPYAENRIIVTLNQIAPIMQKAQIAIEDSRFYEHGGLDMRGLSRAVVSTLGGEKQGASTLTQQYVKLTLQENALREDDQEKARAAVARSGVAGITRKLQELKYAVNLEQNLTKDKILESYLNLAYYGDQAYGVEAAAQHYFSISAAKLNYNQAALLAGLVQQPGKTDPIHFQKAAQARRDVVLDRMAGLGVITAKQAADGKKVGVKSMLKPKGSLNTCQRSTEPYFCEFVMAWLKTQKSLGKDPAERLKNINTQGLTIQTSLKPGLSKKMREYVTAKVPIGDKSTVGGAATVVEPGTGKILGMAQSTTFGRSKLDKAGNVIPGTGKTEVNWNVDRAYGGSNYGFQIGSTAKMFAIVTALTNGIPIDSQLYAKFADTRRAAVYTSEDNTDDCDWVGPWNVRNDDPRGGRIPFRLATASSINTAFASLVMRLGVCNVQATYTKMGVHQGSGEPIQKLPAPVTLGADGVSPLVLASAYATLAANGKYCTPVPVTSITTFDKKKIKVDGPNCKQVIRPDVAAGATELLRGVITSGTGRNAQLSGGRPAAGKTGTTDNHVQSWFVGYTPQLATAVYVGTPERDKEMDSLRIGDRYYANVFGGTIAAPLWAQITNYASRDMAVKSFERPSDKITRGEYVSIPGVTGMSYDSAKATLEGKGFTVYNAGNLNSSIPRGLVAGSTPSGSGLKGTAVGLYISTGYVPPPPPPPRPPTKPSTKPTPKTTTTTKTTPTKKTTPTRPTRPPKTK